MPAPAASTPTKRVHEDAHHLADLSADLGVGFLQSTILLVSFIGVLPETLSEILAYPQRKQRFYRRAAVTALGKVGIDRLENRLEQDARWDHEPCKDDQRLLAFVRLALQKPAWIVIDEALDALPAEAREKVLALLDHELAGAAIGRSERPGKSFVRSFKLVPRQPEGGASQSGAGKSPAATEKSRKADFSPPL